MVPTDATLVERCLAGRREAFEEIVKRHQHQVYMVAYGITRDREEALDLAQETFLQAYRKLNLFDSQYGFRTWLLTICANLGKNVLRKRFRAYRTEKAHWEVQEQLFHDTGQARMEMEEALACIPQMFRVPLLLKHMEGFSYEEIALILKIGVSAAKMRVKRGRDHLVGVLTERPEGGTP